MICTNNRYRILVMEWRTIPGYTRYETSADGRIRRKLPARSPMVKVGMILKPRIGKCGRLTVCAARDADGKCPPVFVHHLVAFAFIGPRPSQKHQIDHKNKQQGDNHWRNLHWVTSKQNHANADHAAEHGSMHKLTWPEVRRIRKAYENGDTQQAIADEYGVTQANISSIVLGITWKESAVRLTGRSGKSQSSTLG